MHDGRENVGRRERIQSTLSKTDTFELLWEPALSVHLRGSNKGSKERRGPALGIRFTEVSVKRESTVIGYFVFIYLNRSPTERGLNFLKKLAGGHYSQIPKRTNTHAPKYKAV